MKKLPSRFLSAHQRVDSILTRCVSEGLLLKARQIVSLTDVSGCERPLDQQYVKPGGRRDFDGLKRPSYGRSLTNKPSMSSGVAGQSRRGAVTIVALVVLMILAGLIAQQVSRALSDRRHSRQHVLYLQTEKLAEAGLEVAATSHAADPAWTGFTWKIPAGGIHQTNTAEVTIRVLDGICTVVSRYPTNNEIPYQVTRTRKLTP